MKRYIYLISPQTINGTKFYNKLHQVLKTNKVRYFQLRLKKISTPNLLKISKKVKKIASKNNVKFFFKSWISFSIIFNPYFSAEFLLAITATFLDNFPSARSCAALAVSSSSFAYNSQPAKSIYTYLLILIPPVHFFHSNGWNTFQRIDNH